MSFLIKQDKMTEIQDEKQKILSIFDYYINNKDIIKSSFNEYLDDNIKEFYKNIQSYIPLCDRTQNWLQQICEYKSYNHIQFLIENGFIDEMIYYNIRLNQLEAIKLIIKYGISVNYITQIYTNYSILGLSLQHDSLDIAQYLIDFGANIKNLNEDKSWIHYIDDLNTLKFLIKYGYHQNSYKNEFQHSLHHNCEFGNLENVIYLIEFANFDINLKVNKNGRDCISALIYKKHSHILHYLILNDYINMDKYQFRLIDYFCKHDSDYTIFIRLLEKTIKRINGKHIKYLKKSFIEILLSNNLVYDGKIKLKILLALDCYYPPELQNKIEELLEDPINITEYRKSLLTLKLRIKYNIPLNLVDYCAIELQKMKNIDYEFLPMDLQERIKV